MKSKMKVSEIQVILNGRKDMGNIDELASSIKDKGILVPLIVNNRNELIAGHRRLEAAKSLGMKEVPVIEMQSAGADFEEIQIIENLHRKDLTAVEEAVQYRDYMAKYKVSLEDFFVSRNNSCFPIYYRTLIISCKSRFKNINVVKYRKWDIRICINIYQFESLFCTMKIDFILI